MLEIFGICFASLIIIVGSFIPEDYQDKMGMLFINIICLLIFASAIYSLAYDVGIKEGACNQLRGKYEVTYVIDKDSCIVDTIINLN